MKWLRVKNLRSISDSGPIPIRPITLLVGKNGSGKSSFLRILPMLRQSVESRTRGQLLWFGDSVDFGSFGNAVKSDSDPGEITLALSSKIRPAHLPHRILHRMGEIECAISMRLRSDTKDEKTYVGDVRLQVASDNVFLKIDSNGTIRKFQVNNMGFPQDIITKFRASNNLIPNIFLTEPTDRHRQVRTPYYSPLYYGNPFASLLFPFLTEKSRGLFSKKVSDKTIVQVLVRLDYSNEKEFLRRLKNIRTGGIVFQRNMASLESVTPQVREVRNVIVGMQVPLFLHVLDEKISATAQQVNYIGPVRATAQRFYRTQELAVDRIDYKGQNMAEFLRSLSDTERTGFRKWTSECLSFEVLPKKKGEHIQLKLIETGSKNEYNLADTGFGFSQVLPIAAQLWAITSQHKSPKKNIPNLFCIEQPELHLHPNYQARVADMMVTAINSARASDLDVRLIIETHSQTIVNRIGNLVADGKIDKEDVSVALFEKASPDQETSVRLSEFDSDGFLTNWPFGFFDPEQG
jgi:hypothetical protein